MEITGYIRELLFTHDCVIIPGFGGFIGNYTPARIDKSAGIIHPPVKQISFNRNLNHNDGLLVGRISEANGLNYGDARNIAGDYVEGILRKLSKGEKVVLEGIGSFVNNHEGNIQYEPDSSVNFHLNAFGLEPLNFAPLEKFEHSARGHNQVSKSGERRRIGRYLWRAAVIIPVAGTIAAVTLTTDIFRSGGQLTNMNPLAAVEFDSNRNAPDLTRQNTSVVKESDSAVLKNESPEVQAVVQPAEEYMIIAGSFQSEANARILIKKLADDGYTPELISAQNGFYRVCAEKCSSLGEAVVKKDSIALKYSGSWITRSK